MEYSVAVKCVDMSFAAVWNPARSDEVQCAYYPNVG